MKTQQKISGRLTSDDATQDRLDIRSYIDTARKHGHDALTVLRSLMTGTPWRPSAPAAARHNQPPPRMTRGTSLCVHGVIVYRETARGTQAPYREGV